MVFYKKDPDGEIEKMRLLESVVYAYPDDYPTRTMQVTVFSEDQAGYVVLNGTDDWEDEEEAFIGRTDPETDEFIGEIRRGIQGLLNKESVRMAEECEWGVFYKER